MEADCFPYPCGQEIMGCKIAHRTIICSNKDSMVKRMENNKHINC